MNILSLNHICVKSYVIHIYIYRFHSILLLNMPSKSKCKMKGVVCAFYGCKNSQGTTPKRSFHRFPDPRSDEQRYKQWVKAVSRHRGNWSGPVKGSNRWRTTVVCSDHFERNCFVKGAGFVKRMLDKTAVPTKYCLTSVTKEKKSKRMTRNYLGIVNKVRLLIMG